MRKFNHNIIDKIRNRFFYSFNTKKKVIVYYLLYLFKFIHLKRNY